MSAHLLLLIALSLSTVPLLGAIGARGSAAVALQFKGSASSVSSPIASTDPITVWCAPDNNSVQIKQASFVRKSDKKSHEATVSENQKNATWEIKQPTINDAGEWVCKLNTHKYGNLTYVVHIYARPVAHPHSAEAYTVVGEKESHLEAPTLGVQYGESVNLSCPVVGHPQPLIKWAKDGQPLGLSDDVELDGNTVRISNADGEKGGVYTCTAINEFAVRGKTSKPMLIIDKMLKVKSEWAWLVPLLIIVGILLVLVVVIALCEVRRKRNEKRSNQYEVQE